jgi:hypothetical protein
MPLDNHLFADLQEGAGKNVALSHHIKFGDPFFHRKYSFATPRKVYESLQRTIAAGCPSSNRIIEDISRVFCSTLQRIIDANGTYIEDSSTKKIRHGVRAEAASIERKKRETLPVDSAMMDHFLGMVDRMKEGGGVTFAVDETMEELEDAEEILATTLTTRNNEEDDEDGVTEGPDEDDEEDE